MALLTKQQQQQVLVETVKTFGSQEWFRDATVYNSFPTSGEPTLEFKVNYVPLFERKQIKEFVLCFNLVDRFLIVDRNGNPVE